MAKLKFYFDGSSFFTDFIKENFEFEATTKLDSDIIISSKFPVGIYDTKEIQTIINSYKNEKKLVLILLISDSDATFKLYNNIVLFRTSIKKSKRDQREYVLPYVWECFSDEISILQKTEQPIVGFCGSIKKNLGKRLSTIKAFENNPKIQSNFILRTEFWGGKPQDSDLKKEFKNNIVQSHFTISNRGRGNFSMRFYQVLSLGKIPVLLHSDMLLPFEETINWSKYIIEAKTENQLVANVISFWNDKSDTEIVQLQIDIKKVFETYFTPINLGKKINEILQNRLLNYLPNEKEKKGFFSYFKF